MCTVLHTVPKSKCACLHEVTSEYGGEVDRFFCWRFLKAVIRTIVWRREKKTTTKKNNRFVCVYRCRSLSTWLGDNNWIGQTDQLTSNIEHNKQNSCSGQKSTLLQLQLKEMKETTEAVEIKMKLFPGSQINAKLYFWHSLVFSLFSYRAETVCVVHNLHLLFENSYFHLIKQTSMSHKERRAALTDM